jgi:glycosyltransferase involved in cell wall biosynthesis
MELIINHKVDTHAGSFDEQKQFASEKSIDLSVIVPLYNEYENVETLYEKIIAELERLSLTYEVIFVDDGSTDDTWSVIEQVKKANQQLSAIRLRRNYGQTSAMVAGFDHAKGNIIVTLDGDLQNDPSDIALLLQKLDEGYDIVSGWRKDRKDNFLRVLPSRMANAIISFATRIKLNDYGCTLKAYRSECIKPLNAYAEMHRFFPALASMTGARIAEIPVKHYQRKYGTSKYGFSRIFKVLSDIIAISLIISFSSTPLKGFILCVLPFLFLTVCFGMLGSFAILLEWTIGKSVFFLISMALNGMAVIHLFTLGVLGELVVSTSDLTHTQMPEISKKILPINGETE